MFEMGIDFVPNYMTRWCQHPLYRFSLNVIAIDCIDVVYCVSLRLVATGRYQ